MLFKPKKKKKWNGWFKGKHSDETWIVSWNIKCEKYHRPQRKIQRNLNNERIYEILKADLGDLT